MTRTPARCILPLPEEVVAKIKSSTAIVSLTGVALELLKNSLDAKATKIEATVDFARGGCTVEDDGLGISPLEFSEEGGLGKLYCTSKYHASDVLFGRNGTFLASLTAMSLLTIASRHHEYRSHNSTTFHHAKAVERQLPAAAHHQVHGKHGTRVTVRNLFGNLPVRVKQRSKLSEQKAEQERLWDGLKRDIAGLLLSWQGPVSLRVRDGDNRVVLSFNTSNSTIEANEHSKHIVTPRSASLSSLLNVLTQAKYIAVGQWASWVPASASTSALSIKGAISLDPAPSKHVQFISLGIRPLSPDAGHNELYDEVNRLFALSSFGTIEDGADVGEFEKVRRQSDKRFKKDGYTNRQLKARKDVDRHPMFHLRVSFKEDSEARFSEDRLIYEEANLQNVMDILAEIVTQWLAVHHFRPRQPRNKHSRPGTASSAFSDSTESATPSVKSRVVPVARTGDRTASQPRPSGPSSVSASTCKRKRLTTTASHEPSEKLQRRAFAEWSRIKSGKADFFNHLPTSLKTADRAHLGESASGQHFNTGTYRHTRAGGFASFDIDPVPQGALSIQTPLHKPSVPAVNFSAVNGAYDDTILWTDPSTMKTYLLNSRTGCVVPDARPRPNTDSTTPTFGLTQKTMNKSSRLAPRPATGISGKTPWLDDVLQTWDNPIFKPSERRIQQVSLHEYEFDHGHQHHHRCPRIDIDKAFNEASTAGSSRLSKEGLRAARVISQVDKKFILVKMPKSWNSAVVQDAHAELLVLIDQHAADERVQVESLLRELCTPLTQKGAHSCYQSKLGHVAHVASVLVEKPAQFTISAQEWTHLTTHAARFAAWGILYDTYKSLPCTSQSKVLGKEQYFLSVTMLPPGISERCKADPKVLISFLRSTVWKYAEDPYLLPLPSPSTVAISEPTHWVRRLATCPPGLVDLINSRACRSAIMFNDELSVEECNDLVGKLAGCVFPFMCAHGRPSMVPLVDLGSVGDDAGGLDGEVDSGDGGFVRAWKTWKR
ncbi:DNA mismatch repair protein [Clathrospora elynae]|uniref:DNA mismatch repair protein n=1 Tax=Clathrospora elynae TaxID=706981 RepID=A0A6A5TB77_9PLEO|nr:DNA mismatch repair protein [Clathrospora elynae]